MFLRQSTIQTIRFGPFLDSTDGVTAETGLTIAQADMQLSKDGAAFAQKNAAGNATHDTDGWYSTSLNATDTGTVGELYLQVAVTGALPVWVRWQVVEEAVYDAMYAANASGPLQPTVAGRTLDVAADGAIEVVDQVENVQVLGAGSIAPLSFQANSITNGAIAADSIGASELAANAIGATQIANNAITADKIAANAIGSDELAANCITATQFADNTITSSKIAAGAIGVSEAPNLDAAVSTRAQPNDDMQVNAASLANINAEVDAALADIHLDHLLAVDYNPAAIPGAAGAWVNEVSENDGSGNIRYTAKALEQAPSGGGGGLTQQEVRDAMKLSPTAGAPSAGSIDLHLDDIEADVTGINGDPMRGTDGAQLSGPVDLNADQSGVTIGTVNALGTQAKADVNAEMVDVMDTDTITLPGQEAPPLMPTHRQAIAWLYKVFRNRKTQTATQWSLYADNETTVDARAPVSDDGTTATKQEIVAGP